MLGIYADMIRTATRQDRWNPPDHGIQPHDATPSARAHEQRERRQMRRWFRDTGIL